jgi:hypothetical protein
MQTAARYRHPLTFVGFRGLFEPYRNVERAAVDVHAESYSRADRATLVRRRAVDALQGNWGKRSHLRFSIGSPHALMVKLAGRFRKGRPVLPETEGP